MVANWQVGYAQQPALNEIRDAFGLTNGSLISLEGDFQSARSTIAEISIEGQQYELELHPYSIRSEKFVLKVQDTDGSIRIVEPTPPQTVRGLLRGSKGSFVAGSIVDSGVGAKIIMGDGAVYFLEPVRSKFHDWADSRQHILYTDNDMKPHPGRCGVLDRRLVPFEKVRLDRQMEERRRRLVAQDEPFFQELNGPIGTQIAEIGLDADVQFFNTYGSIAATVNRMEQVLNIMNNQYERDVEISHVVTGAIVRTSEPDPYSTTDASDLLGQFRNEWRNNQTDIDRDVAQLFTGKNLNGSTIGIAFRGVICGGFAYGVVQSNFNGSLNCATDLSAHELGHNWNATHCNCSNRTMNPSITCANRFSNESINTIVNHRNSRGCLDTKGPANDNFANSIPISLPASLTETNEGTTTEVGEPDTADVGATVWWSFIAPGNGMARVDLEGSTFDTVLHIYTGGTSGVENLLPVAFNDDETNTMQSDVNFPVVGGQRYQIRVGGFGNGASAAQGEIQLSATFLSHGPVDIFLSNRDLFSGALNNSGSVGEFNSGSSGSIFVYYDPMFSELDTGMFIDVATSRPGVVDFTRAESFDFDVVANGVPFAVRWGDAFGELADVSSNYIDEMGAFTIVDGTGMLQQNTGPTIIDTGYDFVAGAFLFGQIDFDVVGEPGDSVNIMMTRGVSMIVNDGVALDPEFGSFRLVVADEILLGDVNCDGAVNLLDVVPFVDLITSGTFSSKADFDGDGEVNLLDVEPFVDAVTGG